MTVNCVTVEAPEDPLTFISEVKKKVRMDGWMDGLVEGYNGVQCRNDLKLLNGSAYVHVARPTPTCPVSCQLF